MPFVTLKHTLRLLLCDRFILLLNNIYSYNYFYVPLSYFHLYITNCILKFSFRYCRLGCKCSSKTLINVFGRYMVRILVESFAKITDNYPFLPQLIQLKITRYKPRPLSNSYLYNIPYYFLISFSTI